MSKLFLITQLVSYLPLNAQAKQVRCKIRKKAKVKNTLATSETQQITCCSSRIRGKRGQVGLILIRLYQLCLSPFLGNCCRFYPSCSEYAMQALKKHGYCKGGWLICKRLVKCHPFHPGGVDFVP